MDKHTHSSKSHFDESKGLLNKRRYKIKHKSDQDLDIMFQNPVSSVGSNKSFPFHVFLLRASTLRRLRMSLTMNTQQIVDCFDMQETEGHKIIYRWHETPAVWKKMNYSLSTLCAKYPRKQGICFHLFWQLWTHFRILELHSRGDYWYRGINLK